MKKMFKSMLYSMLPYLHMPQFSTVQGVCKSPAFLFVLLLHAYSYTLDHEIFMLRIIPIEDFLWR